MKNSDIGKKIISEELPLIPKSPGIYQMLNEKKEVLYIGKAKNLPKRLKSYVSERNHVIRTERMLSQTKKIDLKLDKVDLNNLINRKDKYGKYAWSVISKIIKYASSLVPGITDKFNNIDEAMRLGFNWTKGCLLYTSDAADE